MIAIPVQRRRPLVRARGVSIPGKLLGVSWGLTLAICVLAAVGYTMLYSAAGGSTEPWASRHGYRFGVSVLILLAVAVVDLRVWMRLAWPLYALGIALLVVVEVHGAVNKGAQRWIDLGFMQLQPSELMKIFLVLVLARCFHRLGPERIGNPLNLIVPILAVLLPVALILKQPNLGTALITAMLGGGLFFLAGVRLWKFALVLGAGGVAAPIAYDSLHDYQRQRILTFLDPESDPLGSGYHVIQSKIALGSGGFWGRGYLEGTQSQLSFLPEKQTDFIFTMLAEEFGLVGAAGLMTLIAVIVVWGMVIAMRCRNPFGRLLGAGITLNFFLYVFVNIAMNMGMIPVGGVPLPLVSHGGSAMMTAMFGFGLLMSVHVHRLQELEGDEEG